MSQNVMYNAEIKQEFLSNRDQHVTLTLRGLFNRAASFEEHFEKDLYDFNYGEFILFFERNGYAVASRVSPLKSLIKDYITWATARGYCSGNSIIEIERVKTSDIAGYYMTLAKYFRNIDELLNCIENVYICNGGDATAYEPLQLFYGLYWYGLGDEEIYNLKPQNIQGEIICVGEQRIAIDKRLSNIAQKVCEQEYFIGIDGKKRTYADSVYVFKSIAKSQVNVPINTNFHVTKNKLWRSLMENVPLTNQFYGKVLSTVAIKRCGFFYKLYEMEKEGKVINNAVVRELLINQYADEKIAKSSLISMAANRLIDYKKWKAYCEL